MDDFGPFEENPKGFGPKDALKWQCEVSSCLDVKNSYKIQNPGLQLL